MKLKEIKKTIEIPDEVNISVDDFVAVKGPKGEIKKRFAHPELSIFSEHKKIRIEGKGVEKKTKRIVNSIAAHIKNMIRGVLSGYEYKLKICSGHFPINVSIMGNVLVIKNFLGEKYPRVMRIKEGVEVNVVKDEITVSGIDKEIVGQVAADIEQLTRISNRDRRVFQDGIYIVSKG